jgi:flagellar hook assembly protein FlgD
VGVTVQVLPAVQIPKRFHLEQNYPNPFNSSTVISYTSVAGAEFSIKIYNILGQEVATLVTGRQAAGNRAVVERSEVEWNAVDRKGKPLPSGIYLCQMVSGSHVETRKLVLLR